MLMVVWEEGGGLNFLKKTSGNPFLGAKMRLVLD